MNVFQPICASFNDSELPAKTVFVHQPILKLGPSMSIAAADVGPKMDDSEAIWF